MKIVFCDDEVEITEMLTKYVCEFFTMNKLKKPTCLVFSSGEELITDNPKEVDIAFLDVEMSGISGIYAGEFLKKNNPKAKVIIVTSYSEYLDEAMRFNVFRYLSKPIDKNRLFRNIRDAISQIVDESHPVIIDTTDASFVFESSEVICIESLNKEVLAYTTKGLFITKNKMEYFKDKLISKSFFQAHRSFIINLKYVRSYDRESILLSFDNNEIDVYLARRKYSEFKKAFVMYLGCVE